MLVGRGHDPADAPIPLNWHRLFEGVPDAAFYTLRFTHRVGGVMTPPYELFYFSEIV